MISAEPPPLPDPEGSPPPLPEPTAEPPPLPVSDPESSPAPEPKPRVQYRVVPIRIRMRARIPWMTYAILAANLACFGWTVAQPDESFVHHYGHIRSAVRAGDYWRLLTATFLHAGVAHVAMNMLLHLYLGRLMERILGHWRFLVLYFVAGLGGGLFFQVASEGFLGMGASGAVYGVFGAFLLLRSSLHRRTKLEPVWNFVLWATVVVVLDYAFALIVEEFSGMGVAYSAHVGGFLSGAALGAFWLGLIVPVAPLYRKLRPAALSGLVVLLVSLSAYALYLAPPEEASEAALRVLVIEVRKSAQAGELDRAAALWHEIAAQESQEKYALGIRVEGYLLMGKCMARGRQDLGNEILDRLIQIGIEAMHRARQSHVPLLELRNEVAWYCALRGEALPTALQLAEAAVSEARRRVRGWPWTWIFPRMVRTEDVSMCVNTRGWVRFRLEDYRGALEDLQEAVDLLPNGSNYLYLGLAYLHLSEVPAAREAARKARAARVEGEYEEFLLKYLIEQLGGI